MLFKIWTIVHGLISDFFTDRVPQFAAALSFYAAFSMAPLLILILTILAFLLDGAQAREFVIVQIGTHLGEQVAGTVDSMLIRAAQTQPRGAATLVATGVMLIGATAVIMSLKSALDHIFGSHDYESARAIWLSLVKARFKAFAMVLILSGLLATSLLFTVVAGGISAAVTATPVGGVLPDWVDLAAWLNTSAAMFVVALLFYIVYRFFPDKPPDRRAALAGAVVAAFLLSLGKRAITWYIATVGTASAFGAAGALAVILVWIFVSANIVLLGAEFAKTCEREVFSPPPGPRPD
ncbi:MAG: YihY/virulence factor BrkB family protein [Burkholderiaceae bacterium]